MSSSLPQSPLTKDIPNAAYPTAGLGLVLGTNGLMDPTAIATGTRTGLKFLRDDQTWQTPAGGGSAPGYGTTFPGSPADGDQYILVDSTTLATYQWLFRYNAGSSNTDKWEFIGGTAAIVMVDTDESTTSTTYVDLTTAGPSFTVPRAGTFEVVFGAQPYNSTTTGTVGIISPKWGTAAASDNDSIEMTNHAANAAEGAPTRTISKALSASDVIKLQYRSNGGGTGHFRWRWLSVRPIRCS